MFGDDRDRAHRCPECDSHHWLSRGSAACVDVPILDTEIAAGRHGVSPTSGGDLPGRYWTLRGP